MPDRNGYIGRAPSDSAVTVARQTFTPTGVTTDFTFSSGYVPGYFDVYINGAKQIEASDYTSTDGSTFSILNGGVTTGDVIEAVAYKAFNAGTVTNAADFTVSGNLTVNGSATFVSAGTSVSFATTAYNLEGTPDVTVNDITARNITGVAATFTGVVTYEDVTNVDSVGVVTAQSGINIVGGGATVTGVSTFFDTVRVGSAITLGSSSGIITATGVNVTGVVTAVSYQGDGSSLTGVASTDNIITGTAATFTGGVTISGSSNVNVTGIITATSFSGDGSALTGVGGELDITSSLFI
jgi:hypothetical protein